MSCVPFTKQVNVGSRIKTRDYSDKEFLVIRNWSKDGQYILVNLYDNVLAKPEGNTLKEFEEDLNKKFSQWEIVSG